MYYKAKVALEKYGQLSKFTICSHFTIAYNINSYCEIEC